MSRHARYITLTTLQTLHTSPTPYTPTLPSHRQPLNLPNPDLLIFDWSAALPDFDLVIAAPTSDVDMNSHGC